MGNIGTKKISYEDGAYLDHSCLQRDLKDCKALGLGKYRDYNCMLGLMNKCKLSGEQIKALVGAAEEHRREDNGEKGKQDDHKMAKMEQETQEAHGSQEAQETRVQQEGKTEGFGNIQNGVIITFLIFLLIAIIVIRQMA